MIFLNFILPFPNLRKSVICYSNNKNIIIFWHTNKAKETSEGDYCSRWVLSIWTTLSHGSPSLSCQNSGFLKMNTLAWNALVFKCPNTKEFCLPFCLSKKITDSYVFQSYWPKYAGIAVSIEIFYMTPLFSFHFCNWDKCIH